MSVPEVTIESADNRTLSLKVGGKHFFVDMRDLEDVERWISDIARYAYNEGRDDSQQEIERNLLNTLRGVR